MSRLGNEHQQAVADCATFLAQQYNIQTLVEANLEPEAIVRPERETAIAAIIKIEKNLFHA